mmetsp:Transcript_34811/g.45816  ORF Transcript_34811/g.45816 Transcript_34811/m.45816 type:complete len:100 (-) Transcript_34811:527-826(-)
MPYRDNEKHKSTLDPYIVNMSLEYGPILVYDDDRTIDEDDRKTHDGWYFRPKIDAHTISLFEGDVIVMYVQLRNPKNKKEFESWSCSMTYEMKNGSYVG